jgi:hypothetical protein
VSPTQEYSYLPQGTMPSMGALEVVARPWKVYPNFLLGSPRRGWQEPVAPPVGWNFETTARRHFLDFTSHR